MKDNNISKVLLPLLVAGVSVSAAQEVNRTKLPIADPKPQKFTEENVRNVKKPENSNLGIQAPKDAPNVVVILLDDFGFGQGSTFGGPIEMPTLDALAKEGLRYNQFHTTALSSPTRTALLTGRNHHKNNMGAISEAATSFPGNTGIRPNNIATLPKILKYNGYATAMFGKNHEVPAWESGPAGNQRLWPTSIGFEKFYGFFGGETDQFQPVLVDGITRIPTPRTENYHFTTDMTNKAIEWMKLQKSYNPEKPFFTYYAPGAVHAPHQAPKEWIDKYKGKFSEGWDVMREKTFKKQKEMGIIPANTVLPPKVDYVKDWDTLSEKEKKIYERQMEVYAGFASHADNEIGRLINALKEMGEYENTLIFYIAGDNGASPEGNARGSLNSLSFYNKVNEDIDYVYKNLDKLGSVESFGHYATGWSIAGNAPFAWSKGVASDFGGTRNGMVISWPKMIKKGGDIRTQWSHVTDIAPTVLEAAKLPEPKEVDGIKQDPIQGTSMLYTIDKPKAQSRHTRQYFEIAGNRAIYDNGWLARVIHVPLWEDSTPFQSLEEDKWELYDTRKDFSLANNVADKYPEKLKELRKIFDEEAIKNKVYPIDDRTIERLNAQIAGRPDAIAGRTSLTLYEGAIGIPENSFINIKNKSYEIVAELNIEDPAKTNGVIIAQGGDYAGWSLFVKNGVPMHEYNWLSYERTVLTGDTKLKKGKNQLKYVFKYDENGKGGKGDMAGLGKGGNAYLYLNDKLIGKTFIPNTVSTMFSFDDGVAVGEDDGGRASNQYNAPFRFNEKINKVVVTLLK